MITLNLLPDVKREYLAAVRKRNTVIFAALIVLGTAIGLTIFLFVTTGVQSVLINRGAETLKEKHQELLAIEDAEELLTVRNQLAVLPSIHHEKPDAQRLFTFLAKSTPNEVALNELEIFFTEGENTIEIVGTGPDLLAANIFADTLKNARYQVVEEGETTEEQTKLKPDELEQYPRAFQNVAATLEVQTARGDDGEDTVVFVINLSYAPEIFENDFEQVNLLIPDIISTRSETEAPNDLFNEPEEEEGVNGNGSGGGTNG